MYIIFVSLPYLFELQAIRDLQGRTSLLPLYCHQLHKPMESISEFQGEKYLFLFMVTFF